MALCILIQESDGLHKMNESHDKMIFTIGHSNQRMESFLNLLTKNKIQYLADVRSVPSSKFASQFDQALLKNSLTKIGIRYLYFGREIGGRPSGPAFYDEKGYALYYLMAQSPSFVKAIDILVRELEKHRIVIMCSEEDPTECHRRLLIGRVLSQKGITELHIRGNGSIQTEADLVKNQPSNQNKIQLSFFTQEKEEVWKSAKPIRSVSQNEPQKNSLEP
jgi:uncharacterized protein (DUF488 family)